MSALTELFHELVSAVHYELVKLEGTSITVLTIVQLLVLSALLIIYAPRLNAMLLKQLSGNFHISHALRAAFIRATRSLFLLLGFFLIFHVIGIDNWIFKQLNFLYGGLQAIVDLKLFELGHTQLTLLSAIYILVLSLLLVRFCAQLQTLLLSKYLARTKLEPGMQRMIATSSHYIVLFLGFLILLQTAGIELSSMTVMLGALGVGISFGLQTITNNLISGLIILFERPIKLGDKVQIGDVSGEVVNISLRATTVVTRDNVAIFVPNSQFITSNVTNWSYNGGSVGIKIPVVVVSNTDPDQIKKILLEVAKRNSEVLKTPAPSVIFEEMSKDTFKFSTHVWTRNFTELPDILRSEMNFEVTHRLRIPPTYMMPEGQVSFEPPAQKNAG